MASLKERVSPMSLINQSLNRMDFAGFNPRKRKSPKTILAFVSLFLVIAVYLLQIVYVLTKKYSEAAYLILDMVMLAGYLQLIAKSYAVLSKHRPLVKLINIVDTKFWPLETIEESKRKEIQKLYNLVQLLMNAYLFGITMSIMFHYTASYIKGKGNLIVNIWMPEVLVEWNSTFLGHSIIFGFEAIVLVLPVYSGLVELDGMYIILILVMVGQFKMLKIKLLSLSGECDENENLKLVAKCIQHHSLLLDYVKDIEEVFSTVLLQIAASCSFVTVLAIYSSLVEQDISRLLSLTIMSSLTTLQLFLYCLLGQVIQNETKSVADAVYECKWEDIPDKRIRNSLILIMLRSQNYASITAGRLFIVNLENFTNLMRTMLSLLTFLINTNAADT